MTSALMVLLRIAGAGLLLLALLHIPISKSLGWREDGARMSPVNASVFRVHTFFICVVLVMMAAPCLVEPQVFIESSDAGRWLSGSFAIFCAIRLYAQWFMYPSALWRGRRMETLTHAFVTVVWSSLAAVFGACTLIQFGLLSP